MTQRRRKNERKNPPTEVEINPGNLKSPRRGREEISPRRGRERRVRRRVEMIRRNLRRVLMRRRKGRRLRMKVGRYYRTYFFLHLLLIFRL